MSLTAATFLQNTFIYLQLTHVGAANNGQVLERGFTEMERDMTDDTLQLDFF